MSEPKKEEIRERLAALEHDRWARWQKHVHALCVRNEDGSLTIPSSYVRHWERQVGASYDNLGEREKDSDRAEADNMLAVLAGYFADQATTKS